jgi:hypothetical protein
VVEEVVLKVKMVEQVVLAAVADSIPLPAALVMQEVIHQ